MMRIAVSSRALFNFEAEHKVFEEQGIEAFRAMQLKLAKQPAEPGVAFRLVRKLMALNALAPNSVDVLVISRNDPLTGVRVLRSCEHHQLGIERGTFTGGESHFRYLVDAGIDLYLSANGEDVARALSLGIPAAAVFAGTHADDGDDDLRIAFDGDAVLFSGESEAIYGMEGLDAFRRHEREHALLPMKDGPMKPFLSALLTLCRNPEIRPRIRLGMFTARGFEAAERTIVTLAHWGLPVDEALFLGGAPKAPMLKRFNADFFFDDQERHCQLAAGTVPTGRVLPVAEPEAATPPSSLPRRPRMP